MWRLVDAGAQDAATAIGRLPALAQSAASGGRDGVVLTGYWGRAHLNVGWFEDVDVTVDLAEAARAGVDVVRRPMIGGGTAFYDEGCAATAAFLVPPGSGETLDDVLDRHQRLLRAALDRIGLRDAAFEGSSDIRWRGRKLGALISQVVFGVRVAGCFLNLRRPDLALYRRVAHVPPEKFADKAVKDMIEYVATPADVRGRDLEYGEFRDAVLGAFRDASGADATPVPATPEEDANIASVAELVCSQEWVTRVSSERFRRDAPDGARLGFANHKGRKLVRAGVAITGDGRIASAMLAGDMHLSPPNVLDDLAAKLVGLDAGDAKMIGRLAAEALAGAEQADVHLGVTADDLVTAIEKAIGGASH